MNLFRLQSIFLKRGHAEILRNFSWQMQSGENWTLVGPNGSGKSSLASILLGYTWPTSGIVEVMEEKYGEVNLQEIRKRVGIFQPALQSAVEVYHDSMTAYEIVCTGAEGTLALYQDVLPELRKKADSLWEKFQKGGILKFPSDRPFSLLSSGEKRKVLLLRTLLNDPAFIILDEPYESLDIPSRLEMEHTFEYLADREKHSILLVVHRIEEIPSFITHTLLLKNGSTLHSGRIEDVLTSENLSELYETPLHVEKKYNRFICVPVRQ